MTETERQVLSFLDRRLVAAAWQVGSMLWPNRRGRTCAVQGGGDYAAQMLLGRLRKKGWVRVADGTGSSEWTLTSLGRRELKAWQFVATEQMDGRR